MTGSSMKVAEKEALLSPDEHRRAERFHYPKDRSAFINARASLRRLLGSYLHRPPEAISFDYGAYGKPSLPETEQTGLNFNLSHAGGYALIGFTTGQPIGVDLEAEDPSIEIERLTERFFSPEESRQVLALPAADRVPAFFRTWTRKEAFLKANGAGLSLPLEEFGVTVNLRKPVRIERIKWAPQEVNNWVLSSFMVTEGLPGAVVVGGRLEGLCFYDLTAH